MIKLTVINEQGVGTATSVAGWPWWIWLLIVLGLILLLCLLPLLLLLWSRLRVHGRKVSDSNATVSRPTPAKVSNILARTKEMEANGVSEESLRRPSVLPPPASTRIFRIPSDSPTASAHSTASQSRIAVVRQQESRTPWAERTIRSETESRSTLGRRIGARHLESVIEERGDVDKYEETTESGSKFQPAIHQQTTCEEKFFKRSDRQNRMFEEGYDRAQLTYTTTPGRHFSHSEVV